MKWGCYTQPAEEYTSKTCGACGQVNYFLGSKKTFECFCGNVCDCNIHAARNILLKWLSTEADARVVETFVASRSILTDLLMSLTLSAFIPWYIGYFP